MFALTRAVDWIALDRLKVIAGGSLPSPIDPAPSVARAKLLSPRESFALTIRDRNAASRQVLNRRLKTLAITFVIKNGRKSRRKDKRSDGARLTSARTKSTDRNSPQRGDSPMKQNFGAASLSVLITLDRNDGPISKI